MDRVPQKSADVDMEEDADSVQECTEAEVNDQLGPRSTSGLSDSMGAVSLEAQVGSSDKVQTKVLQVTEEYTTIQIPRKSWESVRPDGSAGGARGRAPEPKASGSQRTVSLDRAAIARMVRAAATARSASSAARGSTVTTKHSIESERSKRGKTVIIKPW